MILRRPGAAETSTPRQFLPASCRSAFEDSSPTPVVTRPRPLPRVAGAVWRQPPHPSSILTTRFNSGVVIAPLSPSPWPHLPVAASQPPDQSSTTPRLPWTHACRPACPCLVVAPSRRTPARAPGCRFVHRASPCARPTQRARPRTGENARLGKSLCRALYLRSLRCPSAAVPCQGFLRGDRRMKKQKTINLVRSTQNHVLVDQERRRGDRDAGGGYNNQRPATVVRLRTSETIRLALCGIAVDVEI